MPDALCSFWGVGIGHQQSEKEVDVTYLGREIGRVTQYLIPWVCSRASTSHVAYSSSFHRDTTHDHMTNFLIQINHIR
jgi:hypothetical protein